MPAERPTNRVLAALPRADLQHWQPHLERIELDAQHTLQKPGAPIEFVHFPMGALVGLMREQGNGAWEAPVALVGLDGVVGLAPLLGVEVERTRAVVLQAGGAWRLPTAVLQRQPVDGTTVLHVVFRYLQALNAQIAQNALCRLHHTVAQRLCRWLLDAFDRVPGEALDIDVAVLGGWLGADGEAVTQAARQLDAAGVIELKPGRIVLRDRTALSQRSCGCHALVKRQADRMFPPTD